MDNPNLEIATFGAGCFWCVEAVFQRLKGVEKLVSGYMGGKSPNPTYREVCSGLSGHAEVVQMHFDPAVISFPELLEILWTTHDPTTLNRQGADKGTQYRSVIYFHGEEQRLQALDSMKHIATTLWDDPIVTELSPATNFYIGEASHQNYYENHQSQGYCRVVILPKLAKVREKFSNKLKTKENV